ncbi:HemK family protein methyltransferase [Candidatus Saccharibacteria bacterium]|nr:HemK family protein methyltransferase [Candidatus Saccharibacteria bacterium]
MSHCEMGEKMSDRTRSTLVDFYGRDFFVTKNVLTPRPETEQLIDMVLTLAGKPFLPGVKAPKPVLPNNPTIIDVGTGSGCIAITIKKELPEANLIAVDIDKQTIKIAQKNAAKHGTPIPFIISHLLTNVKYEPSHAPDLVVANLPYVDSTWPWLDKTALSREDPDIALYADDGGLALIKELIDQTATIHVPHLILEADPCQHNRIIEYARKRGFSLRKASGFMLYFSL